MWIKGNEIYFNRIILNGYYVYNPTEEQLKLAGYVWVEPQQDNREWVDKELFVNAVYELVPAEAIPAALADPETAKSAIAGMALLSTGAAPGNMVDLSDPRVAEWLAVGGVTVDEVRAAIEKLSLIV